MAESQDSAGWNFVKAFTKNYGYGTLLIIAGLDWVVGTTDWIPAVGITLGLIATALVFYIEGFALKRWDNANTNIKFQIVIMSLIAGMLISLPGYIFGTGYAGLLALLKISEAKS